MRALYAGNRCHHLKSPVTVQASLRAIGPIHAEILQSAHTDIDTYRFLETFIAHMLAVFGEPPKARPRKSPPHPARVIAFPVRRRGRR